jgi:hypothetical protein
MRGENWCDRSRRIKCRNQAITRFDRMSEMAIYHQLAPDDALV